MNEWMNEWMQTAHTCYSKHEYIKWQKKTENREQYDKVHCIISNCRIRKWQSESVNRRRTYNTIAKRKGQKDKQRSTKSYTEN